MFLSRFNYMLGFRIGKTCCFLEYLGTTCNMFIQTIIITLKTVCML